jgi:hypothetical protein
MLYPTLVFLFLPLKGLLKCGQETHLAHISTDSTAIAFFYPSSFLCLTTAFIGGLLSSTQDIVYINIVLYFVIPTVCPCETIAEMFGVLF